MLEKYLQFFKDEIKIVHYNLDEKSFKEITFRREYVSFYESAKADEFIEFLENFCWDVEEVSGGFIFKLKEDYIVVIMDYIEWLKDM